MIFIKKHLWNFIFFVIMSFIIYKQAPVWINSYNQINTQITFTQAVDTNGKLFNIPDRRQKTVYIFWATWCPPCHTQLNQFKSAVIDGKINSQQIVAVNLGEDIELVKAYQAEHQYPFSLVISKASKPWKKFNVEATPSIAFTDNTGKIVNFFAGLSPLASLQAQYFLD